MKDILVIISTFIILTSCSSKHGDAKSTVDAPEFSTHHDKGSFYLQDPLRNLNNFDSDLKQTVFESTLNELNSDPNVKVTIQKEFNVGGDTYYSYKIIEDKESKVKLYLFKEGSGEYGFGNDQYLFKNDTLSIYRQFSFGYNWATDTSQEMQLTMTEIIYLFESDRVTIKQREKVILDEDKYSYLDNLKFKVSFADRNSILEKKLKDFQEEINLVKDKVDEN